MDRVRFADEQDRPVDGPGLRFLLAFAMDRLGIEKPVSLAVVDDERIAGLNLRFHATEGPTDVLAFPLDDPSEPDPDPELGEIVVSADTAARQAEELGIPFARELALLALHGLLHLSGLRDASPAEGEAMLRAGEELLDAFEDIGN